MNWKRFLVGLLWWFSASIPCTLIYASGQSAQSPLTVDESRSQVHSTNDGITPVLAIENSGSETTALVRVELLNPEGVVLATAESHAQLYSGSNQVSLPFHGWTQKPSEWNESIWYRIRYSITPQNEASGPAGILSLAAKADGMFDLRVVASKQTAPGMPLRVRVYTRALNTLLPMAGVQISAQLESDDQDTTLKLTSITNMHGFAQMEFKIPAKEPWGSSASLTVTARKGQLVREATDSVSFIAHWKFFITTDKPLYQPGQVVHIRTLLQDWTKHAVAKAPVIVSIEDENQTLAFRTTSETSRFGVARADWEVPENVRLGEYAIKVSGGTDDTEDESGSQTIRISRYELPTFSVNVAPDRAYYLPGPAATIRVNADYLFGKPVTKGHVRVARESDRTWNFKDQRWDSNEVHKWEGETDGDGKFAANIDLSDEFEGLPEYDRFRDLDYGAYFTDSSTGKTEQRRFRLRITHDPIHLYIIESSNAVGQLPLEFYISASYADGSPAQCNVAISTGLTDDEKPGAFLRSVRTNRYGVAKVRGLNVPLNSPKTGYPSARIVLEANDHEGRRGRITQDFWDAGDHLTVQVLTNHALYRPSEPVDVELFANRKSVNLLLDVLREGRVIQSQQARVRNGHAFLTIPYSPDFQGEVSIVADAPMDLENQYYVPFWTHTVLYPHDPALKVVAKFDHATYRPGEDAVLDLHVRGSDGNPVTAAVGSVIFDQAVEERARTDAEFGRDRGYGFYDSFRGYWHEPAELGGLKREDLDRLDVSQPFADDIQLAAEVLLADRWDAGAPLVFGGADYPDGLGSAFRELLDKELAPVTKALNDAYDHGMRYPHDEESLRQLLRDHGVEFEKVLDPWGSPFRAQFSFRQSLAVLDLLSSGPDKKVGTADDVTALTMQRWYFRPTAEAIRKAMAEYHGRTGGYIRDLPTLKTELGKAGVQWDALRDPWGQPYKLQFGISNTRYTLAVMSGGPDGKFEDSTAVSDDFPVWTEFSEYFSETAVKIDYALARSFAATQKFPENEAEFYKVLDEAHIPRRALVDAWGHPVWPVFDNQAKFIDRVVMDYSQVAGERQTSTKIQPETGQFAFIHLYSAGMDGILHNSDDFELAVFSREVTRQNSTMTEPAQTPGAVPLSGGSGAITGIVTDPSGAVVADVKVTAELQDRATFAAETDSAGRYTLRNLPTGFYTVTAAANGFRQVTVNRVPVKSLSSTEVNLTLQLGASTETVEVAASAVSVQTSTATVASVGRPSQGTEAGGPISTPRLREFFPETLLWEPMLETDSRGNSRLRFKFADSITNWRLSLVASTIDGQMGLLDSGIKTFQPFFVEHEPPPVLTQGDEIALPVVLRNYLEKSQTLRVEMKPENWFKLLGPSVREASVAAGESERIPFRFQVTGAIGDVKQRVTAANRETGDAVEKPLRIHPDGEPRTATSSRLFAARGDLDLEIPKDAMPGSVQAELKIYPNLMAHVLEGSRSLLERPYGCGEQTVSSTYPNVMLLRLYTQAGKAHDEVYRSALHFARLGYERLLSYQHEDGGVSVWKQDKPDLALTAYALHFLVDAREFIEVDRAAIEAEGQWLARQQAANGSWQERSDESTGLTAYIALALAKSRHAETAQNPVTSPAETASVDTALKHALDYLRGHWSAANDPYAIAQVALAAFESGDQTLGAQVNEKLRTMVHREGHSAYWALESNTLFYGWGTPGRVETTALAVQALSADTNAEENTDRDLVEEGLIFLIENKDGYGAWYSGQTTINVLNAFLRLPAPPASRSDAQIAEVIVNGEKAGTVKLPGPHEVVAPLHVDLEKFIRPGINHISISRSGESQTASAQAVARYYVPWTHPSKEALRTGDSRALDLRVSYDHTQVHAAQEIHCKVHAERIGFRGHGMLLAEIGLPPGAVVDRASMEQAMSGWNISQYEIRPDRLVVYLWSKPGGTDFEFTFRPRYGMNALTAASTVYDYYNPEAQAVVPPTRIEVQ